VNRFPVVSRRRRAPIVAAALLLGAFALLGTGRAEAEEAPDAAPLIEKANAHYGAQEWAEAAAAYEAVLKVVPNEGRAWYRLGASYANLKQYDRAIAAYRRGVAIGNNPIVMYNLACAFARNGDTDSALVWLERTVDGGYRQPDAMDADEDLASLRSDERYRALLEKTRRNAKPCAFSAEARQFDFWVGAWDVRTLAGDLAGTNEIRLGAGDCVLVESWTSMRGGSGQSLNFYDRDAKKWRQIWVDADGEVTRFEGSFVDGSMRFVGERVEKTGKRVPVKMTFTPIPDGRVRQRGESSADDGKTWTEEYDLYYSSMKREG
jgi:tetratricopeptide (TPR) repeat protein